MADIPKENQEFTRYNNKREPPIYTLNNVFPNDWRLFMWFASLEKAENYIYLFIVIWDALPVRNNETFSKEFNEETTEMIQIIEELGVVDTNYSKILNDYKNYRYDVNQVLRRNLVHNAWVELEGCGLKYYSYAVLDQLCRCTIAQKKELRRMVLSRMKSFQAFARLMKEDSNDERETKSIIKVNESLSSQPLVSTNDEELIKLKNQVNTLIKENSEQQAALGNLTNVSWNDDDPHNSQKLISDIEELQDTLSDFTMVQGVEYKIIDETARNLLRDHNCKVDYPSTKASNVLGAILQRLAIKMILEAAQVYLFDPSYVDNDKDVTLEKDIVNITESLIEYTEVFRNNRKGDDYITKITPIKIRQHTYSALSCRGLSEEHPLIKKTASKLLNEMNKYRSVIDEETNSELNNQAIHITHKVINIFCFCLRTQAFEPKYKFFLAGDVVDARLMQGAFGRDDFKKLEVEVCGFPCIGIFDGDKSNHRVFTKARVITRPK